MARGRRTTGAALVEHLDGPAVAKQRLRVILETMAGKLTVKEASKKLGIGVRRFHDLRTQFLEESIDRLAPRPAGRPRGSTSTTDQTVARLQAEVEDLRVRLQAALVREEIALTMPQLLQRKTKKKTKLNGRQRGGTKRGT